MSKYRSEVRWILNLASDKRANFPITSKRHLLDKLRNPVRLFDNDRENRCFDFFRSFSAPKSTTFYGSDFWLKRVLQMSHSEPAVKDAALALSSLHHYQESELWPHPETRSAILYYSRAVSRAKPLLSQNTRENIEKLLVICVLFIFYENLTGNFPTAMMHLQNGLYILSESRKPSGGQSIPHQAIPDDILHTFSRIDIQAMVFSDCRTPYPFSAIPRTEPGSIPSSFLSVAEAQYHLFEHFKWRLVEEGMFHDAGAEIPPLRQSWLASRLTTWEISFAALQLQQREEPSITEMESELVITQIYYELFTIVSNSAFTRLEISYDACYPKFERILTLVESLPVVSGSGRAVVEKSSYQKALSFEWGVICPLYFVMVRCRDPHLRRQALARLYALNRREGTWDSLGTARLAERVVEMEEEGLENVQTSEDISNDRRIIDTHFVVEMDQRTISLTWTLKSDPDGPVQTKNDVISF